MLQGRSQTFAKLQEGLLTSFRLSVRTERVGPQWTDFYEIWYVSTFRESVENVKVQLKC